MDTIGQTRWWPPKKRIRRGPGNGSWQSMEWEMAGNLPFCRQLTTCGGRIDPFATLIPGRQGCKCRWQIGDAFQYQDVIRSSCDGQCHSAPNSEQGSVPLLAHATLRSTYRWVHPSPSST